LALLLLNDTLTTEEVTHRENGMEMCLIDGGIRRLFQGTVFPGQTEGTMKHFVRMSVNVAKLELAALAICYVSGLTV
jgi:hypothetical protein